MKMPLIGNRNHKIQCGYEDDCKASSCLDCPKMVELRDTKITLAEATCIEDFAVVDLDQWGKEKPDDRDISQDIMRKLMKRLDW